jgi:hypothetical protein
MEEFNEQVMNQEEERVATISAEDAKQMEQEAKAVLKVADALDRLMVNPDFKTVFIEEYTKKEPGRITLLMAEQSWVLDTKEKKTLIREDLQERMIGVARFHEYIRKVYMMANEAQNKLDSLAEAKIVYNN